MADRDEDTALGQEVSDVGNGVTGVDGPTAGRQVGMDERERQAVPVVLVSVGGGDGNTVGRES